MAIAVKLRGRNRLMLPRTTHSHKPPHVLLFVLAVLYALLMIKLLFVRVPHQVAPFSYNLVPFRTINNYIEHYSYFNFETWFKNLFGNVAMFVPIGIFAPLLSRKLRKVIPFFFFTILLLLGIETVQLVARVGSFDVDDIMLNFAGAAIGRIALAFRGSAR